MKSTIMSSAAALVAAAILFSVMTTTVNGDVVTEINLTANDIAYSQVSDLIYASVPSTASVNPNTLLPINPYNTATGAPISIGFNPGTIAASSDGTNLFTVVDGDGAVQRYNVPTQTADQLFTTGSAKIGDIYGVPGSPNEVILHAYAAGTSPPAVDTAVYNNATELPQQVGSGVGVGGPDIFAVDPTDGTKAYGYQNSITSFTNFPMVISSQGVEGTGVPALLQGVLTGFGISNIAIDGDRLYTSLGQIYSFSIGEQVGSFNGGSDFILDPANNKLFSITSSNSTQTINAYSLTTMALLGTDTLSNIAGTTSNLTRFGANGLAFQTSAGQIVFVQSTIVPEPSSVVLVGFGVAGLCFAVRRRKR